MNLVKKSIHQFSRKFSNRHNIYTPRIPLDFKNSDKILLFAMNNNTIFYRRYFKTAVILFLSFFSAKSLYENKKQRGYFVQFFKAIFIVALLGYLYYHYLDL